MSSVDGSSIATACVRQVGKENELRIDVPIDCDRNFGVPSVTLREGRAEIFGAEMAPDETVELAPGASVAVFTWEGCSVELHGQLRAYIATETPMSQYAKVQYLLERHRSAAATSLPPVPATLAASSSSSSSSSASSPMSQGPRVVVVGPVDYGKSTLCRILCNWAVRMERTPIFVDLDIGQGEISIPGLVAAVRLYRPFEQCKQLAAPLALFVGTTSPSENPALVKQQVENLMTIVNQRLACDASARSSGLIVNTGGFIDGLGFELLVHAIATIRATHVLVIDHDRLKSDLEEQFRRSNADVRVLKVRKSGGVISRDRGTRRSARNARFKEYFYGPRNTFCPASITLDAARVQIFQILGTSDALGSALPIGADREANRIVPIEPCNQLVHSILAVSYAEERDKILSTNVAGFVYVTAVSPDKTRLSCLAPCPGPLPGSVLIFGNLKFFDQFE